MRKPLVAGNWKMNGSRTSIQALIEGIISGATDLEGADIVVCPPFVFLSEVVQALAHSRIAVGAQNVAIPEQGAFTGEVSASMLKDVGCEYVIIGHSERRALYGESDEIIAEKFASALALGLTPILCVGESLEEREAGTTENVVERQLASIIQYNGIAAFSNAVIAYEPVWAIGTGKTATPHQAQEVHAFIRQLLNIQNASIAAKIRILYGGSMKSANATELLAQGDIDGGLIGGASLSRDDFIAICSAATKV